MRRAGARRVATSLPGAPERSPRDAAPVASGCTFRLSSRKRDEIWPLSRRELLAAPRRSLFPSKRSALVPTDHRALC